MSAGTWVSSALSCHKRRAASSSYEAFDDRISTPRLLRKTPLTPSSAGDVAAWTEIHEPLSTGLRMNENRLKGNGTFMLVLTKPGSTALDVTPVPLSRRASSYVNSRFSSLVWLYTRIPS